MNWGFLTALNSEIHKLQKGLLDLKKVPQA
jgi:hypothetical protein